MTEQRMVTAHSLIELFPSLIGSFRSGLRCSGLNLDPAHFRLLAMIGHRTWSQSELAGYVGVTPATISNSIDTLVERGWVHRHPGTDDRRKVLLEITSLGRETMLRVHQNMELQFADRLQGATDQELSRIQDGITLLHRLLKPGNPVKIPCPAGYGSQED